MNTPQTAHPGSSAGSSPQVGSYTGDASSCTGDVCITCSDTAVQVRVTKLLPDGMAQVDTGAGQEEVSVALVSAEVGDSILVHAGEAIGVVTEP